MPPEGKPNTNLSQERQQLKHLLKSQFIELEHFLSVFEGHVPVKHQFHQCVINDDTTAASSSGASSEDLSAAYNVEGCEPRSVSFFADIRPVPSTFGASLNLSHQQSLATLVAASGNLSRSVAATTTTNNNNNSTHTTPGRVLFTPSSSTSNTPSRPGTSTEEQNEVHMSDGHHTPPPIAAQRHSSDDYPPPNTSPMSIGADNAAVWAELSVGALPVPQMKQVNNKAVLTLDWKTTEILIANDMVCKLFGVNSEQLIGRQLSEMIMSAANQRTGSPPALLDESLIDKNNSNRLVAAYGKVIDVMNTHHDIVPVSVWSYPIANTTNMKIPPADASTQTGTETGDVSRRWLIVLEPVERITAHCTLGPKGRLFCADDSLADMFGYTSLPEMLGTPIDHLIPAIQLGVDAVPMKQQQQQQRHNTSRPMHYCGVTKSGATFPLSAQLCVIRDEDSGDPLKFELSVTVFMSVSGVVTLLADGTVHSYNPNFMNTLLGYHSDKLRHQPITRMIPKFYRDLEDVVADEDLPLPPLDHSTDDDDGENGDEESRLCINWHRRLRIDDSERWRTGSPRTGTLESHNSAQTLTTQLSVTTTNSGGTPTCSGTVSPCAPCTSPRRHVSVTVLDHGGLDTIDGLDTNLTSPTSPTVAPTCAPVNRGYSMVESTPKTKPMTVGLIESQQSLRDGTFSGCAKHSDGSMIAIWYQVKRLCLKDGTTLYSVWIHRDHRWATQSSTNDSTTTPNNNNSSLVNAPQLNSSQSCCPLPFQAQSRPYPTQTMGSVEEQPSRQSSVCSGIYINRKPTTDHQHQICAGQQPPNQGDVSALHHQAHSTGDKQDYLSPKTTNQVDTLSESIAAASGEYSQRYNTMAQIGKGAFGCVKLAARHSDGLLVVTKFICKEKVLIDSWVQNNEGERVPIEIHLLTKLKHPNVVKVVDVYENEQYYQLVMEKHGAGMDLFEFIDRRPQIDEPLASYIFRQIVSAVAFLDLQNVVHRDLKDENVIIDETFTCKLIDFGSAAYFGHGKVFSTFCGTVEYCSPEVLTGNKYVGPELEIWSLGILLYTIIFGENPFCTAEETIRADLEFPTAVTESLENLLCWLLHPVVAYRADIIGLQQHWWLKQKVDITQYRWVDVVPHLEPYEVHPPTYLSDLSTHDRELLLHMETLH